MWIYFSASRSNCCNFWHSVQPGLVRLYDALVAGASLRLFVGYALFAHPFVGCLRQGESSTFHSILDIQCEFWREFLNFWLLFLGHFNGWSGLLLHPFSDDALFFSANLGWISQTASGRGPQRFAYFNN